jgi:hypothetical protein
MDGIGRQAPASGSFASDLYPSMVAELMLQ